MQSPTDFLDSDINSNEDSKKREVGIPRNLKQTVSCSEPFPGKNLWRSFKNENILEFAHVHQKFLEIIKMFYYAYIVLVRRDDSLPVLYQFYYVNTRAHRYCF